MNLDSTNFVSNERLAEVLAEADATAELKSAAQALNVEARLTGLRTGLLVLAAVSATAIIPARRLPKYLPQGPTESFSGARESTLWRN